MEFSRDNKRKPCGAIVVPIRVRIYAIYTTRAINSRSERKGRTHRFTSPLSRVIRARRQRIASMPEIKEPVVERPRDKEREREKESKRGEQQNCARDSANKASPTKYTLTPDFIRTCGAPG